MTDNEKLCKNIVFNISRNICLVYLLESPHWVDSNKYPKHMFYKEIRKYKGLSCISFCSLRSLYSSKFVLMTSFGTNAGVATRVHCFFFCFFFFCSKEVNFGTSGLLSYIQNPFWGTNSSRLEPTYFQKEWKPFWTSYFPLNYSFPLRHLNLF